jgi:hypothetical protein
MIITRNVASTEEVKEMGNSLNIIQHHINAICVAGSESELLTYSHICDEGVPR